ncbi:hypothetical protein JOB18_017747 [Solea senegalensis]|uniref:Uncharacterized protein n=1 Tax=Solea senegalensis TaxID=28829 RepID=A0AAV6S9D3_SOLSE|nr:hypothetical protein JOB18_017747 [Solea senegalensis]
MMESYALMVLVMGTFFIYFCGMVWAFCNPKLSGAEEESATGRQAAAHGDDSCASNPAERNPRCVCAHVAPPYTTEEIAPFTQTTYVNFCDDTNSLLSQCSALCREDHGLYSQSGFSSSCAALTEKGVI